MLAEIPIISNDPGELEALQARLASPETFARVGLAPPQGIVSDLQFAVALDANGRPVIRVTSSQPVQQPLLTFLVEVDWGQGRLVREYSALLDTPQTAAAPVQPPIDEATTTDNAVVRLPDPEPAPATSSDPLTAAAPTPVPLPPQPQPPPPTPAASETASANALDAPAPIPVPLPAEQTAMPLETAAPIDVIEGETRVVRRGETLGGIASGLGGGYNLDQTIVALLRANPEAFIDGNVNRLKAGAVLRIPDSESIARFSPDEAALVVREQTAQWRASRRALPQPPAVVGTVPGTRAEPVAAASSASAGGRRNAQARLEIVPPSASDARRAGTRSGVSAGGEGDMLRQQELQEAHETVAAREAEVQELKARVAELEKLQQQQQQLITMKDSELAAVQERLATAGRQPSAPTQAPAANFGPWIGIGAGLLVIGLLAFWWLNRRSRSAVGSAMPAEAARMSPEAVAGAFAHGDEDEIAGLREGDVAFVAGDEGLPEEPAWNRLAKPAEAEPPPPTPAPRSVPTWHSGGVEIGPLNPAPPGRNRLDLARAYLEMGDRETARSLLREVIARGDTLAVREEASRLLNELA